MKSVIFPVSPLSSVNLLVSVTSPLLLLFPLFLSWNLSLLHSLLSVFCLLQQRLVSGDLTISLKVFQLTIQSKKRLLVRVSIKVSSNAKSIAAFPSKSYISVAEKDHFGRLTLKSFARSFQALWGCLNPNYALFAPQFKFPKLCLGSTERQMGRAD